MEYLRALGIRGVVTTKVLDDDEEDHVERAIEEKAIYVRKVTEGLGQGGRHQELLRLIFDPSVKISNVACIVYDTELRDKKPSHRKLVFISVAESEEFFSILRTHYKIGE